MEKEKEINMIKHHIFNTIKNENFYVLRKVSTNEAINVSFSSSGLA